MDDNPDSSTDGFSGRIAEIEGFARRLWSEEERARIAAPSMMSGAKLADVARRQGVTRWQVCDWRRRLGSGRSTLPDRAMREAPLAA